MAQNQKRIFQYLLDLLIVVFGVFLGMYASEIQSKNRINREKSKSISFIVEELLSNKASLERSIAYHQSIKVKIDSISNILTEENKFEKYFGNRVFRHTEIEGWRGVQVANFEHTAFEAAKISGIIKEYDIAFIKDISSLYTYQEKYTEFGNSILSRMINLTSSSTVLDAFGSLELMVVDLLQFETFILTKFEKLEQFSESSSGL